MQPVSIALATVVMVTLVALTQHVTVRWERAGRISFRTRVLLHALALAAIGPVGMLFIGGLPMAWVLGSVFFVATFLFGIWRRVRRSGGSRGQGRSAVL